MILLCPEGTDSFQVEAVGLLQEKMHKKIKPQFTENIVGIYLRSFNMVFKESGEKHESYKLET